MGGAITIKKFGPWNVFMSMPRRASRILPKVGEKAINNAAEDLSKAIKGTITKGGAGGPSLSSATIARKGHGIKLVDSHALSNGVEVIPVKVGGEGFVGFRDGGLSKIAAFQEFGTAKMPARPFIAPTIKSFGPTFVGSVAKTWINGIKDLM